MRRSMSENVEHNAALKVCIEVLSFDYSTSINLTVLPNETFSR